MESERQSAKRRGWTVRSAHLWSEAEILAWLATLTEPEARRHREAWTTWAQHHQIPPETNWRIWLLQGGRGSGKTRAGAEWIREAARNRKARIALVGPTYNDVREVMMCGPSGLLSIGTDAERPVFAPSRRRVEWPSGAVGYTFSAEDPDGLRGPQFTAAWADEFAAWARPQQTLDMLRLGLRLGERPRLVVTTTPRPIPALRKLLNSTSVAVTRASTAANRRNLSDGFFEAMQAQYGGSALARQELDGELVDDPDGALWTRSLIEQAFHAAVFEPERIVVAVDPPATGRGDECGIVAAGAAGSGRERRALVMADASLRARPEDWADRVWTLFEQVGADQVVAEANQGGDMVRAVLQARHADLPVRLVHATRGKRARAEPIVLRYAAGEVSHASRFPTLEDQMCSFGAPDFEGSPDRVDALVWALTALFDVGPPPRLRVL